MQPQELSTTGRKFFDIIEFDDKEQLLYEIRKHPFGLFIIYLTGFFISVAVVIVTFLVSSFLKGDRLGTGNDLSVLRPAVVIAGLIIAVLGVVMTVVGALLYKGNVALVTNQKIAQVLYKSLFDRSISQLGIGDVQDVTVKQIGILPRAFNYGTLTIETAGEQNNYVFSFTPDPYRAAKEIVGARERDIASHGN